MFQTEMLSAEEKDLIKAAELIKQGEVVGFPTETVYGLAGNALDPEAVAKIFAAKGRPADNPLIVHLADFSEITEYAEDIPDSAYKLAEIFCPGPITMVVKKKDIIPDITSGGLDTVGIRVPVHKTAREFIRLCGVPIAAPSANLSGSPSPTSADHVFADMNGRIPAVIDGGNCPVGVESTVVSFEGNAVRILRPGFVSGEDIKNAGFEVLYAKGVTEKIDEG
ncbi:MAG: L-threonylcarbamoyladenylate synthase, partial [Oscillospiraceae bacterium]|nr:L-threonylcarbamoyladenylate synthase [Oscillospiraceae bacterium]